MLIAVCSDKGSPGATTTALAFASAWPTPAAMVEADPSGGDVALRLRTEHGSVLSETPTVLTLAAASRSTASDDLLERFTHRVNDQLSVVPGPLLAEQVGRVADWQTLAERLVEADRPVLADLGRLHAGSPLLPVAAQADVVVLVARAETESLIRMRERFGLTNNIVVFGGGKDGAFYKEMSDLVGTTRVTRWSFNRSRGVWGSSAYGEDVPVLRPEEIRQLPERHALVVAENAKPFIARLNRCIDGRDGRALLAEQARARGGGSRR